MLPMKSLKLSMFWGRFTWLSLGTAALLWVFDSALDAFLFEGSELVLQLWPDDPKELWMRWLLVTLIIALGAYAQITVEFLRRARQKLDLTSKVFQSAGEAIMVTDTKNNIVEVNRAFEEITGYTSAEVLGKNPSLLQSGRHDPQFYETLWNELVKTGQWQGEIWDRRANGEIYPKWLAITTLSDAEGQVTNYVAVFKDITSIKETESRLHHVAHHDALTGLANRSLLRANMEQALEHARRHEQQVAVLFIDLDRFKDVNDTLGHTLGDQLLKEAAHRLRDCVRASDIAARHGGDEFIVVLTELPTVNVATDIAVKVLDFFGLPFELENHELFVTASIGISMYPTDGLSVDELLKNADVAMYHAKDLGRNNYQYFSQQLNAHAERRLKLLTAVRYTIDKRGFELHYQPQIDLETGVICGVEALIRWNDPELGPVEPDEFIPLCEETGLIHEIDDWVLLEACRQFCTWRKVGCAPSRIAVNISAREVRQTRFVDRVKRVLQETGMIPQQLELEITEHVLVEQNPFVRQTLDSLQELGITLSMDDFGTGYSSLSYLKRLPFNCIKIDRSFVSDIPKDQDDTAITAAIIAMAHSLRLRVYAEGVETEEQIEFLRRQNCNCGQGYVFCRPISGEEFTQLLLERPVYLKSA